MPMMRSGLSMAPVVAAAFGALALSAPASAGPPPWAPANGVRAAQLPPQLVWDPVSRSWVDPRFAGIDDRRDARWREQQARRAYERGYRDALRQQGWGGQSASWGGPYEPYGWNGARPLGRNDAVWRGRDGRLYCQRGDGTTGVVIGAIAGGTLGNVIAGDGQRRLGSIIGGSLGAIIGRELDRGSLRCG